MARKSTKPKVNTWAKDYAPYGHADHKGNAAEWRAAYERRMLGVEEAAAILGDDDSYSILGLSPGADKAAVKTAYRKLVVSRFQAVFNTTTPDPVLSKEFEKVHAAYSFLMGN